MSHIQAPQTERLTTPLKLTEFLTEHNQLVAVIVTNYPDTALTCCECMHTCKYCAVSIGGWIYCGFDIPQEFDTAVNLSIQYLLSKLPDNR